MVNQVRIVVLFLIEWAMFPTTWWAYARAGHCFERADAAYNNGEPVLARALVTAAIQHLRGARAATAAMTLRLRAQGRRADASRMAAQRRYAKRQIQSLQGAL